ncbi:MAG: NAD(P)-dependent oxidoreductase [Gammaproteobacteria bacterium]|nr:NAD(P)-dependent oxidoreductase [Gammaproteobacteria bacterium]
MDIGIMGVGLMGSAFVERYLSQGYTVRVFNRTQNNIHHDIMDLAENGVIVCSTADELISLSSTIILMVSDAEAISNLLQLDQQGAIKSDRQKDLQGKTILQMATISPQQSKQIGAAISSCGGHYLEAPVLGSIPEAKTGTLIIMAGGSKDVFEDALPALQVLGTAPRYIGETGSAAALKLAMNQLIASLTAGFSLSLGYAIKNGVDTNLFMETVRESALYAKTYDKKLQKYLDRDFGTANFSSRHLLKDIQLFIDDAKAAGLNTDALEGIERITNKTVENGMGLMDYSSIYEAICPAD